MADFISQDVSWPGVLACESCSGTVSHGITPATFVLTTYPQTAQPEAMGDLVIGDGVRTARFRDCKLDSINASAGQGGQTFNLTILDRRWKWRTGAISGNYNQLDPRGKLVPWTIRSPFELAELCLKAMGEKNYRIHLPEGLTSAAGKNIQKFLELGANFPQSLTNPPTVWDMTPPAEALARLADLYGCRVIFQPFADRVLIAPLGAGRTLPEGPCEAIAPSLKGPQTPSAVGVAGAPIRIQMRLLLEPVGKEWDQSYRPVNELSYAPQSVGQAQIVLITWAGAGALPTDTPSIEILLGFNAKWALPAPPLADNVTLPFFDFGAGAVNNKLTHIADKINADPALAKLLVANVAGTTMTLTGRAAGFPFTVSLLSDAAPPKFFKLEVVKPAAKPGGNWEACAIPTFREVQPTDRLSYDQAIQLAQESVFKCYRVLNADVSTGTFPIIVPYVGPIERRHQLILQQTKVDQVEPEPRDKRAIKKGNNFNEVIRRAGGGGLPEFYNGRSRDKGAAIYGSTCKRMTNQLWNGDGFNANTLPDDEVHFSFSLDAKEQVVIFADYVWVDAPVVNTLGRQEFPKLTLETAVLVQEVTTGEILRWKMQLPLGGAAPVEWQIREDVQVCIRENYGPKNADRGWDLIDLAQAKARAQYYLLGAAKRFQLVGGENRQYIGIYPIEPDGAVQQVSFSVGPGGASTTASTNSEHSPNILPYPARRRNENLPPNKAAAMANQFERRIEDTIALAMFGVGFTGRQ